MSPPGSVTASRSEPPARDAASRRRCPPVRLFFDGCEFRVDSGELVRGDESVRVAPQPARVLDLLARRSGQVVSREELCDTVWGDGTCVDFEEGLNYCIKQLRRALDDDAASPRFIETVHRRGYRFIAPVKIAESAPAVDELGRRSGARSPRPARLVVLELAEIGPEQPYSRFGTTLSEELLIGLADAVGDRLVVVSGTLERLRRGAEEPGSRDLLLEGNVRVEGETVAVTLRVNRLREGRPLWSRRFAFPWGEQDSCADRAIVGRLVEALVNEALVSDPPASEAPDPGGEVAAGSRS